MSEELLYVKVIIIYWYLSWLIYIFWWTSVKRVSVGEFQLWHYYIHVSITLSLIIILKKHIKWTKSNPADGHVLKYGQVFFYNQDFLKSLVIKSPHNWTFWCSYMLYKKVSMGTEWSFRWPKMCTDWQCWHLMPPMPNKRGIRIFALLNL